MADEIQNLILQVQGQEKLKELNEALALEQKVLSGVIAGHNAGVISLGTFSKMSQEAAANVLVLNKDIAALEKSSGMLRTGGLLQLQYVLDDLTNTSGDWSRKLASISNNIPGLIAGLGGSMGVAGAVGIVSTALIALAPVAKRAWEALVGGEAPHEVLDLLDRIRDKTKQTQSELEKLLKAQGADEKETAQQFEGLVGGKGKEMLGGIAGALQASGRGAKMSEQDRADIRSAENLAMTARTPEQRAEAARQLQATRDRVQRGLNRADLETAGGILGKAPTDRGARDTIRALAAANPGAFDKVDPHLAGNLEAIEPEARAEWDEQMRAHDEMVERAQAGGQSRRKARGVAARKDQARARLKHDQTDAALRKNAGVIAAQKKAANDEVHGLERDFAGTGKEFAEADLDRARGQVTRESQARGFGTPNAAQATDMAQRVISMTAQGVATNDAILSAVMSKAQEIQRLQQRLMQQQMQAARLMSGTDQSGDFPFGGGLN